MESRNKEEAERMIREEKLPPSEKVRNSAEFNPGVDPDHDKFGVPGGGPEEGYYPDRYPPGGPSGGQEVPLGGTDADVKEGLSVEDVDRSMRPTETRDEASSE